MPRWIMPIDDPDGQSRLRARFTEVPTGAGHYESMYIKACHPTEHLGLWIRYTIHKRPDRPPTGSIWFTLFAPGGPQAVKVTTPDVSTAPGQIVIGTYGHLDDRSVTGAIGTGGLDASWDLRIDGTQEPLHHLPASWMYRAPIPRTKVTSPYPDIRLSGRVVVNGEELLLDGWRGMLGHNWGTEHAEQWIWLQGTDFAGDPSAWLDVAIGRIRVGLVTLPWIANGVLSMRGHRHRIGGPRLGATRIQERPDGCLATLSGKDLTVRVRVGAPAEQFVGWIYADPHGGEHHALNCSIAAMELEIDRPSAPRTRLSTAFGATYELGTRRTDHGIPIQPFGDG